MQGTASVNEVYEGYKNYPTYLVHLWMCNNEDIDTECVRYAGKYSAETGSFQYFLREMVEEHLVASSYLQADLLEWTLDNVQWSEIAQDYLER